MDNKQFDHIEQQMKAASQNWEPPFDEGAWERMEKMLEGEGDRKRPFAWWIWLLPLFLLLGSGAYFMLKDDKAGKDEIATTKNIPADNTASNKTTPPDNINTQKEITPAGENSIDQAGTTENKNDISIYKKQGLVKTTVWSPATTSGITDDSKAGGKKVRGDQKGKMRMSVTGSIATNGEESKTTDQPEEKYSKQNNETVNVATNENGKKPDSVATPVVNKKASNDQPVQAKNEEKKNKQLSKFYFSIAGGIEGNGVDFPGTNKFSGRAGLLAGYQLTKKLSVQTGFFAGSKKYVAGKNDYKAKEGSYWSTVDITRVDANCRVFEIPLALRYDFNPSGKWNTFAGAGLSSYIMDKEDYEYEYTRFGTPYYAKANYTGNQHFFSVLRISGGIERKLSDQFSLGINPGLAIPLAGVGDGQVKLFSTEVLLSLKYRPFRKSK